MPPSTSADETCAGGTTAADRRRAVGHTRGDEGRPGAPSFLSPLSWTHAGDALWAVGGVGARLLGIRPGTTDDHRSLRSAR